MAKSVPAAIMDALLDAIAASTLQTVVSDATTPTDLTGALADVAMAPADFTKAVGDAGAGSRKLTMAAKSGVLVDASGTPNHVVLSTAGTINLVTTASGPDLTVGSSVDMPTWKYELGVPA
jgi:hypothetical protein